MITSQQANLHYGDPYTEKHMVLFDVPANMEIGAIPKRVYCNKDLVKPLTDALNHLIARGFVHELKTWDGCFQIRKIRGSASTLSLHSWGLAIDVNAAWNGLGKEPQLSSEFVKCFTDAGFVWGGQFKRKDGMHFELRDIP
jgi:hypothetical protein